MAEPVPTAAPAAAPTPCLEVRGLGAWRDGRVVLDEVSFSLPAGRLGALFGPRGAGQNELFALLAGLRRPASGTMWLSGRPLGEHRAQLGVVFAQPTRDRRADVEAHLMHAAALYGLRGQVARDRAMELLAFIELGDRRDEPVAGLAPEHAWRLELARALIHRPALLLVEDPGASLPAPARARVWRRLLALRRSEQLTLLVTTERAAEAERCDHVLVLDRGRLIADGAPAALAVRPDEDVILLEVDAPERLASQLGAATGLPVAARDGLVEVIAANGEQLLPELIAALGRERVRSATVRRPNLADTFAALTGRGLDDDGGGP